MSIGARLRIRAAVERVGSARARGQHRRGGRLSRIEDHPRRVAGYQSEPADRPAACAGPALTTARDQSVFRHHPAFFVARRPDDSLRQLLQAVPGTRRSACTARTRRRQLSGLLREARTAVSRGLSYLVSYTRSKLKDDASPCLTHRFDRARCQYPLAEASTASLERDYSTGDIPHVFVASAIWDIPLGSDRSGLAGRRARRDRQRLALTGALTLQSGVPIAGHAGNQ